jgi:hypothetical protein
MIGYGTFIVQGFHGLGRHIDLVKPADFIIFQEAGWAQAISTHQVGLGLLKISIALNLMRLSTWRWYIWCLWISIGFVTAYTLAMVMVLLLYCKPLYAYWDTTVVNAQCMNLDDFLNAGLANTIFNIMTDIAFAIFPIPIIWNLQMKLRIRLYVIGILSLGYL